MKAIATQKFVRISPRKIRVVADMVKNLSPQDAIENLSLVRKKASEPLAKTIRSAVSNAEKKGANPSELKINEIQITEGPRLKRGLPVSRGRYHPILKRMSHIRVIVETNLKAQSSKSKAKTKSNKKNTNKDV